MIKRLKERMKVPPINSMDQLYLVLVKEKLTFIVIFRELLFLPRSKHICSISRISKSKLVWIIFSWFMDVQISHFKSCPVSEDLNYGSSAVWQTVIFGNAHLTKEVLNTRARKHTSKWTVFMQLLGISNCVNHSWTWKINLQTFILLHHPIAYIVT